eukprot:2124662-Rhodomonas_salina.1
MKSRTAWDGADQCLVCVRSQQGDRTLSWLLVRAQASSAEPPLVSSAVRLHGRRPAVAAKKGPRESVVHLEGEGGPT